MTVVNAFQCDACTQDIPPEQHGAMLRLIVPNRVEGELHFCGARCLRDWAKAEAKAAK